MPAPLGSFRDFHEPFLNELSRSRHGIRVDFDSGKQVCVTPLVNLCSRATQLNLHSTFHQIGDKLLAHIGRRSGYRIYACYARGALSAARRLARERRV
jgi:hypothetical protein